MTLDARFGPASPAARDILPHELSVHPISRLEVTDESAPLLAQYLSRIPPLQLTSIFSQTFHLLWVMDIDCRIFVAIEELIDGEDRPVGALPTAIAARPNTYKKLGHPALLEGETRLARIGGEIVYDPDFEAGKDWVLTNRSGRYGLRPWQKQDHLNEVCGLLEAKGLYLGVRFTKPVT